VKHQIFGNWEGSEPAAIPPMIKNLKSRVDGSLFSRVKIVVINDPGER